MARSTRLFEQRRGIYQDLGAFLERQRLMVDRAAQAIPLAEPPPDLSDEEQSALLGRAAVEGSRELQDELAAYAKAAHRFLGAAMMFQSLEPRRAGGQIPDGWVEAQAAVEQARAKAFEAIDAVEQAMRDELDKL